MKNKQLLLLLGVGAVIIFGVLLINNLQGQDINTPINKSSGNEIAPHYVEYSQVNLVKAQEKGRAVIYFWAVWCPTCQALDKELKGRSQELPSDVTILKTNYDTEKDLKRKYQIIQQHTLVQVDKNGNEITKWIGGNVDVIKEQLK